MIELSEQGRVSEIESWMLRELNLGLKNRNIVDGNRTDGNTIKSERYSKENYRKLHSWNPIRVIKRDENRIVIKRLIRCQVCHRSMSLNDVIEGVKIDEAEFRNRK